MPDAPALATAVVGALAGVALLVVVLFTLRSRVLSRLPGSFDCAWRRPGRPGWVFGVARFGSGHLDWFRLFSLWPRPARTWPRQVLAVRDRRELRTGEPFSSVPGARAVRCTGSAEEVELAMGPEAYVGFTSWLESAPPGQRGRVT